MRIVLTRQVLSSAGVMLAPGPHDLPEAEAEAYRARGWTDRPPAPRPPPEPPPAPPVVLAEIPADWRDLTRPELVRLAGEIAARPVIRRAEAEEIISEEIARRRRS